MNRNRLLNSDRHPIRLVALLAAALLVAGCTAEGEALAPGEGDEPVEITPTMTINGMEVSTTRAATDNGETFYFGRCDETGVGTGEFGSYPDVPENLLEATRNATTGALTFKTPQYYYTNGRKCRFIGFYPQQTIISSYNIVWEIDGTTDVFIATRLEGSKTDKGISTFNFKHRLTQLQFFPFAETADIAAQWGKITKIEIFAQPSSMFWYYLDGDDASGRIAFSGLSDMTVAGITDAAPFTLPTGGKASATVQAGASTMTGPRTDPDYVLTLRITTEKLGVKTVTRTGALLENTPYRIYLRFTGQAIELAGFEQLNIEDWQDGYPKEVNSGRTYPYVENGNTIVFQDANGMSGLNIHQPWINNDMPEGDELSEQHNAVPKKMEVGMRTGFSQWNIEWLNHNLCPAPWRMPTLQEAFAIRGFKDQLLGVEPIKTDLLSTTAVYNYTYGRFVWKVNQNSTGTALDIACVKTFNQEPNQPIRCVRDIE